MQQLSTVLTSIQDTVSPDTTFQRFAQGVPTVAPPLPGGVATVFRTIFNSPWYAWLAVIMVSLVIAVVVGRKAWTHRATIRTWLTGQQR